MSKQTLINELEELVKKYEKTHEHDQYLHNELWDIVTKEEPVAVVKGLGPLLGYDLSGGVFGPVEREDVEFDGIALVDCSVKTLTKMVTVAKETLDKEKSCG